MASDITFGDLHEDGTLTNVRVLSAADIKRCPTVIFLPSHYRADGTCRHDEPLCEQEGCTNKKCRNEIFCKEHI